MNSIMLCSFFKKKKDAFVCWKNYKLSMNMFTKTSKSKLKMLSSLINCIMSNCTTTNSYKKEKKSVIPQPITRSE